MRVYIILCLVSVVCAEQQGYNYQPEEHADQGLSSNSAAGNYQNAGSAFLAPAASSGSSLLFQPISPPTYSQPDQSSYSAPAASFNKEFYSYSAPEHEFDDAAANQKISNSVKQSLRVIFIKGPENKGLEEAALSLAKQAGEQKTAIYVLNKQADIGELANKLNAVRNNNNNKPEVHFVKYRTAADAANAQQQIQQQYDALAGTSQSHNGGVAPVLNFASQGPVEAAPVARSPGNAYLPASIIRRFRL